jgi:hypothetical protein
MENAEHKRAHLVLPLMQAPTYGVDVLSTKMNAPKEGKNQQPQPTPQLAGEEARDL